MGAIVNVAVAWRCALWLNPFDWPQGPFGTDARQNEYEHWSCYRNDVAGAQARMYTPSVGLNLDDALGMPSQSPSLQECRAPWEASEVLDDTVHTIFDARGWPCVCMWSRLVLSRRPSQCDYGIQTGLSARMTANGGTIPRCLPLGLIGDRFAINTVFYGVILWGLFTAPFALRRRRRIKRGLCPQCAYPVGINERCTECGAAVKTLNAA